MLCCEMAIPRTTNYSSVSLDEYFDKYSKSGDKSSVLYAFTKDDGTTGYFALASQVDTYLSNSIIVKRVKSYAKKFNDSVENLKPNFDYSGYGVVIRSTDDVMGFNRKDISVSTYLEWLGFVISRSYKLGYLFDKLICYSDEYFVLFDNFINSIISFNEDNGFEYRGYELVGYYPCLRRMYPVSNTISELEHPFDIYVNEALDQVISDSFSRFSRNNLHPFRLVVPLRSELKLTKSYDYAISRDVWSDESSCNEIIRFLLDNGFSESDNNIFVVSVSENLLLKVKIASAGVRGFSGLIVKFVMK